MASALEFLHGLSIFHLGLNPAAVYVFGESVKLGWTNARGQDLLAIYGAPEYGQEPAAKAPMDVYALGLLLYSVATCRAPFDAEVPLSCERFT